MRPSTQKKFTFIGKSVLWSLLLYTIMMLAINWEDVSSSISGKNKTTIWNPTSPIAADVNEPPANPTSISAGKNAAHVLMTILRTVTGIADRSRQ